MLPLSLGNYTNNQLETAIAGYERYIAEYCRLYGNAIELKRLAMEGVEPHALPQVECFIESLLADIREAHANRRIIRNLLRRRRADVS